MNKINYEITYYWYHQIISVLLQDIEGLCMLLNKLATSESWPFLEEPWVSNIERFHCILTDRLN